MNTKPAVRSTLIALLTLFLIGAALLAIFIPAAPAVQAASNVAPPPPFMVYLPMLLRNYDPTMPRLFSPSDGAVLDTLIPTFSWDIGSQPPDTGGCFALSTAPNPTGCQMSFGIYTTYREEIMWYNLQPGTVYHWRVGAVYNNDFANPKWSEERTFTTGPTGGVILPAPVLTSPADDSVVSAPDLTVSWQPVAGAVAYGNEFHGLDTDRWFTFSETTDTQITLWDFASFASVYGHNFEWSITARNDYAWGEASPYWKFTFAAPGAPMTRLGSIDHSTRIVKSGIEIERIR